jgi:hypothetical protein
MMSNIAAHVQKPEVYTGGGDIEVFLPEMAWSKIPSDS